MPFLLLAVAATVQSAAPEPITVVGSRWAPFISPMGEPFRPQSSSDDTLARWFLQADRNRDGILVPAEMEADADRFFALLDTETDGEILPAELTAYEWQLAPEVQVNSRRRRAPGEPAPRKISAESDTRDRRDRWREREGYDPEALHGAARYTLINMPQPVAAADLDLNRAISLAEFRLAARQRFALLDRGADRQLTLAELRALVPPPPKAGRRPKPRKDARDPRIGVPVPIEN